MVAASSCGLNRVGGTRVAHRVAVGSYTVWPLGALGPLEAWGGACWTPSGASRLTACPGARAPLLPHGVLVTSEGCWVYFSH